MTEEEFRNIAAPSLEEKASKKSRFTTAMFSIVGNIFFLAVSFGVACGLIFLFKVKFFPQVTNYYLSQLVHLWIPVLLGLAVGFCFQHGLTYLIIKLFKMEDKLDEGFMSHYQKKKK